MGSTACVKDRSRFPINPFVGNEANGTDSDFQMQAKYALKTDSVENTMDANVGSEFFCPKI